MTELEKMKEENRKLREIACFNLLLQNPYLQFQQKKNAAVLIFDYRGFPGRSKNEAGANAPALIFRAQQKSLR